MTEQNPSHRTEPLKIRVITYAMENPEVDEFVKEIDLCNDSDRKWLGKHCFWALCNDKGVTQEPI